MTLLRRARAIAVGLAAVVGWCGSLFVATLTGLDHHGLGVAPVHCADYLPKSDPCPGGRFIYRIIGLPWPPFKLYAIAFAVLGALVVVLATRSRKGAADVEPMGSDVDLPTA